MSRFRFRIVGPTNIPWPIQGHRPRAARAVKVFTDFGGEQGLDVAETELQLWRRLRPNTRVSFTGVDAFDTLGLGFCMAQYAYGLLDKTENDEVIELYPEQLIVLGNSAGRADNPQPRPDGEGEPLILILHSSGVVFCAVDSGYSLSFLKAGALAAYSCDTIDRQTQFRTRDCWPRVIGLIARGDYRAAIEAPYSLDHVPDVPKRVAVYTDRFGNVKTSVRKADIEQYVRERQRDGHVVLTVVLNGEKQEAVVSDGSFNAPDGTLVFAPGSSHLGDRSNPCMELFRRGHVRPYKDKESAADLFKSPSSMQKLVLIDSDGNEVRIAA